MTSIGSDMKDLDLNVLSTWKHKDGKDLAYNSYNFKTVQNISVDTKIHCKFKIF